MRLDKGATMSRAGKHRLFSPLTEKRLYSNCPLDPTNRIAAAALGALIIGAGFVTMRVMDLKVYQLKWAPYLHLTTWTTLFVGAFFVAVGFSNWRPHTVAAALGYLAMFVLTMRLLYFEYDMSDWFSAYKELFAHFLVPLIMLVWLSAKQVNYRVNKNAWRWKSVLVFVAIVVGWFLLNLLVRKVRGEWVYGRHAADPGTTQGRVQGAAGIIIAALCIAFVQIVVVQGCV